MPVTLAIAATERSISAHRMTKVSPTAIMPVIETWFRMFWKFASVRKEGLAALKKITRKSSVAKGAMLRSWLLNHSPKLRRAGAAGSDTDMNAPPNPRRPACGGAQSPTPLREAGPC